MTITWQKFGFVLPLDFFGQLLRLGEGRRQVVGNLQLQVDPLGDVEADERVVQQRRPGQPLLALLLKQA